MKIVTFFSVGEEIGKLAHDGKDFKWSGPALVGERIFDELARGVRGRMGVEFSIAQPDKLMEELRYIYKSPYFAASEVVET